MKHFLLSFLLFFFMAASSFAQTHIIDDFEEGDFGHFNISTDYSGSTAGILDDALALDSTTSFNGSVSLKFMLRDNPAETADWFIRFISGPPSASLSTNDTLGATGYVGYALKVSGGNDGLTCGIGMDAPATATVSDSIQVIRDGEWHLYQWDLGDPNIWHAWVASDGTIKTPVSIDALWFYAPNETPDVNVNLDFVSWNVNGEVPVELISFKSEVTGNKIELRWITATELNNSGFEIQRKAENGKFEKVGFVSGKGTSSEANLYTFLDAVNHAGKYSYRLKQIDFSGKIEYSKTVEVNILAMPGEFALSQNYPNPFNPSTTISYNIPEAGRVSLAVFNLLGEKVADLVNEFKESGNYTVSFAAGNLASGTYIYRLNINGNSITKKMILMK